MVKRLPNWLKIGVQAGFDPNFTVEFEAEIPKKFGLAYWPCSKLIRFKSYFAVPSAYYGIVYQHHKILQEFTLEKQCRVIYLAGTTNHFSFWKK